MVTAPCLAQSVTLRFFAKALGVLALSTVVAVLLLTYGQPYIEPHVSPYLETVSCQRCGPVPRRNYDWEIGSSPGLFSPGCGCGPDSGRLSARL